MAETGAGGLECSFCYFHRSICFGERKEFSRGREGIEDINLGARVCVSITKLFVCERECLHLRQEHEAAAPTGYADIRVA